MRRLPNWWLWFMTVWSRVYESTAHVCSHLETMPTSSGSRTKRYCLLWEPLAPSTTCSRHKAMPKATNCWLQMTWLVFCFRPARPFNPSASSFWFHRASALFSAAQPVKVRSMDLLIWSCWLRTGSKGLRNVKMNLSWHVRHVSRF